MQHRTTLARIRRFALGLFLCAATACAEDGVPPADDELRAEPAALASTGFVTGVTAHNYAKPFSYGYLASDGGDRMGNAITTLGVRYVRGAPIGDVAFLGRLKSFGVTHVIITLEPQSLGKPFDPAKLKSALGASVAEAQRLGLVVIAEGLNEWDLFNGRSYNAGVVPSGTTNGGFIALTQRALYEAAHALGVTVLGPSVGHPNDAKSLALFPDVSAYVDIVNMHLYFGTNPESLPLASHVANHQKFEGAGKPVWVTETGISAYGGVTWAQQADVIRRGLTLFADSSLIQGAFVYQLLDSDKAGWRGLSYTPDSGELHFGVFNYYGQPKTAASTLKAFIAAHP